MRKAARPNPQRTPRSLTQQISAPVKGWTSEVSPVDAEEGTAIILDNWFPEAESIRIRRGFTEHGTGMSGSVDSLLVYTSASDSKLFAAVGTEIYDVTSSGAVGAADVTGLSSAKFQFTMFATASTPYMVICNGADSVRNYDGSSWSTPSITGVTSSTLIHVVPHKARLWFTAINSTDLWYLGVNAISGAATKFGVGGLLKKGGYVMACGTWSVDAGSGMDDLFVIWSSEGEIIVYQGTDPSSSTTWSLVGVFTTGKPIGRRCMFPVGGDLALITEDGVLPISGLMKADRAVASEKALTKRIRQAYADAITRGRDAFGWQLVSHPASNMAILNVPASGSDPTYQFAYNTITGAWARFKGYDANCWASFDNGLYFGGSGTVYRADYGGTDNLDPIETVCLPAYMHLSARGKLKHVKMVQPLYTTDVVASAPDVRVAINYERPVTVSSGSVAEGDWFTWDVSEWDGPDLWFGYSVNYDWNSAGNIGSVISPYTTITIDATDAESDYSYRLTGWTLLYEVGGVL